MFDMKNFKAAVLILFLALLSFNLCFSQDRKKGDVELKPLKYNQQFVDDPGLPSNSDPLSKDPWIVFSDRSKNSYYSSSSLSQKKGVLNYMQPLYVTNKSGAELEVAIFDDINHETKKFNPNCSSLGWIHASNLLLWGECLMSSEGFNRKAMVLNTFDSAQSMTETSEKPIFFSNPNNQDTLKEVGTFEIFHVFKVTDTHLLLGDGWRINSTVRANSEIVGWVKINKSTPWNTRGAWEYNWHPDAVAERSWVLSNDDPTKKRGAIIWDNPDAACVQGTIDVQNSQPVKIENPLYTKRRSGTFDRFPILEQLSPGNAEVGSIGTVVDAEGNPIPDDLIIEVRDKVTGIIATRRQINVLFVIDATHSMCHFNQPIINAIGDVMKRLKIEKTENNYKFGATLFRDEAEASITDKPKGKPIFQNQNTIFSFLNSNMVNDKNKDDKDQPEALFYGIKDAIDHYYGRSSNNNKETNYLILIGDAGDHHNYDGERERTIVDIDQLADQFAQNNINLLAYQVRFMDENMLSKPEDTVWFRGFETDLINLVSRISEKKINGSDFNLITEPLNEGTGKSIYLENNIPFTAKINIQKKGDTLSSNDLSIEVYKALMLIEDNTNREIEKVIDAIYGGSKIDDEVDLSQIAYIIKQLLKQFPNLRPERILSLFQGMKQYYQEGYTCYQGNHTYPIYQPVLLVEQSDLNNILYYSARLSKVEGSVPSLRGEFYNIFMELACMVSGEDCEIGKEEPTPEEQKVIQNLENEYIGDILFRVFGCRTKAEWDNAKVVDLNNPSRFSGEKILEMQEEFAKTEEYLTNIRDAKGDYPGRIPTGKTTFSWWWIPFDVFPHDPKPDDVSLNELYLK